MKRRIEALNVKPREQMVDDRETRVLHVPQDCDKGWPDVSRGLVEASGVDEIERRIASAEHTAVLVGSHDEFMADRRQALTER